MNTIHTVKLKQSNMLCNRCLTNVVKALSLIEGIQELNVNLDKKLVKITYENDKLSKKVIREIINDSIVHGKVDKKIYIDNRAYRES
ncbi:heavy-metal-associated domain-containing protein [Aminipila sp.]|uniref:heavy-metal-associated domain-containing protein n=1 Tax=Aminipila sp. TaxID=2060095 RepID=UPI00289BF7B4|nr:heavy-metal-associated domain-containing protein [Aminipila sp.]